MLISNIRSKFLDYYSEKDLKQWFDPLVLTFQPSENTLETSDNKTLLVKFPHKFYADWFISQHKSSFENTLASLFGKNISVSYGLENKKNYKIPLQLKVADSSSYKLLTDEEDKQDRASFKNFIFNRKNQFPFAAAKNFAEGKSPGVFILFGESGCGKSYLLQAIYSDLKKIVHEKYIFYKQLSDLETFLSKTLKNNESPLSYLGKFKYILLDDLDAVESNNSLQDLLIILLERAQNNKINLALTIRKKPGALSIVDEKLRSLLEAGLAIEIKNPDLDVRRQYVDFLSNKLNLKIKKDDALTLARMYTGFRQIHGALLKVSSFLILSPQAAEAKLADILQPNMTGDSKRLTPEDIIEAVAKYFSLSPADITGNKREKNIVFSRHLSMYLCRELLGAQLAHIGSCFSDRNHSSVLYSINKISSLIKSNKDMHKLVTEVKKTIIN